MISLFNTLETPGEVEDTILRHLLRGEVPDYMTTEDALTYLRDMNQMRERALRHSDAKALTEIPRAMITLRDWIQEEAFQTIKTATAYEFIDSIKTNTATNDTNHPHATGLPSKHISGPSWPNHSGYILDQPLRRRGRAGQKH